MLNALKKQFAVQWREWLAMTLFILGAWIVGLIMHYVIVRTDATVTSYFPMGTVMAAVAAGLCAVIMGVVQLGIYFNIEISMGCTRIHFLVSYYVVSFVFSAFYIVVILALNMIERVLEKNFYSGLTCEIDLLPYLLKGGIPAAAAFCLVSGFCGTLILHYGRKAFWVLWVIWMVCALGIPRIHEAAEEAPDSLFGWIGNKIGFLFSGVTVNEVIGILAVVSVLCLVGTWGFLRRQQVMS